VPAEQPAQPFGPTTSSSEDALPVGGFQRRFAPAVTARNGLPEVTPQGVFDATYE
jgi:hypothetical protein